MDDVQQSVKRLAQSAVYDKTITLFHAAYESDKLIHLIFQHTLIKTGGKIERNGGVLVSHVAPEKLRQKNVEYITAKQQHIISPSRYRHRGDELRTSAGKSVD